MEPTILPTPEMLPALSEAAALAARIQPLLGEAHLGQQTRYTLRRLLGRIHFADLAEVLEHELAEADSLACFAAVGPKQAAQILPGLSEDRQRACLLSLPQAKAARVVRQMAADDAVDLLQSLNPEERRSILGELPLDTDTRTLHQLLTEAPDTAAGVMATEFIQLPVEQTVGDAMQRIRQAQEKDFIYYCYLVDKDQKLVGVVSLKLLLLHADDILLAKIANFDVKSVLESFDQELVAQVFRKYYNLLAMPVVDGHDRLLGIITLDDVVDIIDEENQEDLYRASGITLAEDADERNLISGPAWGAVRARIPWLSITLLGQFVASLIITSFQQTVSHAVIAFSFMPMLSGLAGNMGTQSDTITVRAIALGQIRPDNLQAKLGRELRVAATIGGIFAVLVGGLTLLIYRHWELSLLLASYLLLSMCASATMGILIPFTVKHRFGKDPAGVGGPFITTLSDILMYTAYLSALSLLLDRLI